MATLTGNTIASTYPYLLKLEGTETPLDTDLQTIEDGVGTDSALRISTAGVVSTGTLAVTGISTLSNDLALNYEDPEITIVDTGEDVYASILYNDQAFKILVDRSIDGDNPTLSMGVRNSSQAFEIGWPSPALENDPYVQIGDGYVLRFAGASYNTRFIATEPTAERTITYPDATGTVALTSDTITVGSTSISLGGTATTIAGLTSVTSTGFTGDLTGDVTGSSGSCTGNAATATLASTVTITDSTSNTAFPVVLHDESNALLDDTGTFTYNPDTGLLAVALLDSNSGTFGGTVTATSFVGALTGNATTVTTNANLTGEVTSLGNAATIADDVVDEANLKVSNAPTNGYVLSAQSGDTGGLTWVANTHASGTVTSVTAGAGMTQSGTSTVNPTLDVVGTADRITASADAIDIASTYVGQTSITTLGTVATGTWEGTTVAVAQGGTGATTAGAALTALGAAASGANSDITSLTGLTTGDAVKFTGGGVTNRLIQIGDATGTDQEGSNLIISAGAGTGTGGGGAVIFKVGDTPGSSGSSANSLTTALELDETTLRARFYGALKIEGGSPGVGKVLTSDSGGNASWETASGTGTVTSVGATSDSGSITPITSSGTITFTGGTNVTTSATGSAVTINSTDQYTGTVTGTSSENNVAVWDSTGAAIDGSSNLTFDGSTLTTGDTQFTGQVGIGKTPSATSPLEMTRDGGYYCLLENTEDAVGTSTNTGIHILANDRDTEVDRCSWYIYNVATGGGLNFYQDDTSGDRDPGSIMFTASGDVGIGQTTVAAVDTRLHVEKTGNTYCKIQGNDADAVVAESGDQYLNSESHWYWYNTAAGKLEAYEVNSGTIWLSINPGGGSASQASRMRGAAVGAEICIACSDETTAIDSTGVKATFLIPRAMTVTEVKLSLTTADTTGLTIQAVDYADDPSGGSGTTNMLNAALDSTSGYYATTSTFASSATSYSLGENDFVAVNVTSAGDSQAKGLKVWLIGYYT